MGKIPKISSTISICCVCTTSEIHSWSANGWRFFTRENLYHVFIARSHRWSLHFYWYDKCFWACCRNFALKNSRLGILFLPWEFFLDFPLKRNRQKRSNNDNQPEHQNACKYQICCHGFNNINRDENLQPKQNRARNFFANVRIHRCFRFFLNRILYRTENS